MASLIAWLDASAEEQRRVREIVQLFSQSETQDELGGRRIVVTLSDALFPGTSVLHSRARYLLFIPWIVKIAATRKDPAGNLDWLQRRMIQAFREDESVPYPDRMEGLIGRDAGPQVKQLPSTAFWTALSAWGILQVPGTQLEVLDRTRQQARPHHGDEPDELAERHVSVWHPGVGHPPSGFPIDDIDGGFRLNRAEAEWLRERWLATTDGSLFAHLVRSDDPLVGASAPWEEPRCLQAEPSIVALLHQAQRFSLASTGPRLLYQLMLAERYVERGFDRVVVDLDEIRAWLDDWAGEVEEEHGLFEGWDPAGFWQEVRSRNTRIDPLSQQFFTRWFDLVHHGELDGIADDPTLRAEVADRERFLKKGQARLANDKLLGAWQAGLPGRTTFRWPYVLTFMRDLHEGLNADAGT